MAAVGAAPLISEVVSISTRQTIPWRRSNGRTLRICSRFSKVQVLRVDFWGGPHSGNTEMFLLCGRTGGQVVANLVLAVDLDCRTACTDDTES